MRSGFSILSKIRSGYLYHASGAKTILSFQDFMRPITKPCISDIFSLQQLFISKITGISVILRDYDRSERCPW